MESLLALLLITGTYSDNALNDKNIVYPSDHIIVQVGVGLEILDWKDADWVEKNDKRSVIRWLRVAYGQYNHLPSISYLDSFPAHSEKEARRACELYGWAYARLIEHRSQICAIVRPDIADRLHLQQSEDLVLLYAIGRRWSNFAESCSSTLPIVTRRERLKLVIDAIGEENLLSGNLSALSLLPLSPEEKAFAENVVCWR